MGISYVCSKNSYFSITNRHSNFISMFRCTFCFKLFLSFSITRENSLTFLDFKQDLRTMKTRQTVIKIIGTNSVVGHAEL